MRSFTAARAVSAATLFLSLGVASTADAQGLALDRFNPAPAGDRLFSVPSPFAAGDLTPHFMVLADYAHQPLVLRRESTGENVGELVSDQLFLHLGGTLALWKRLSVNVDVPIALAQAGESPKTSTGLTSPRGAEFGDLRLGLRLTLYGDYFDAFQVGLGGYVWLPTGASGSFVSDGSARGMPHLIVGGHADRFVWSVAVGPEIRGSQTFGKVEQGTMLSGGGGIGVLLDDARNLQIGPEVTFSTVLSDVNSRTTNAEGLLGLRYRFLHDFEAGLGAGPGLSSGVGTPTVRGVAMLAYSPEQAAEPKDRDKDGIDNEQDACPDVPGLGNLDPAKHGCPRSDRDSDGVLDEVDACPDVAGVATDDPTSNGCPSDRDKDGILDVVDACPDLAGVPNEDPAKHGCPPSDRDSDGVLDEVDACPDLPGIKSADPSANGCPGDRDGDTIRDDKDACPNEKGKPNEDPEKNGCPTSVRVTAGEIVILQQVEFDVGRASIRKVSSDLLDQVAAVLKEHPEIKRIEVQGHTDDRGLASQNQKLSQARAESVKKALVDRGIEADKLDPKGYGQDKPVADNKTEAGRQQNRRVQFKIVEKTSRTEPGS